MILHCIPFIFSILEHIIPSSKLSACFEYQITVLIHSTSHMGSLSHPPIFIRFSSSRHQQYNLSYHFQDHHRCSLPFSILPILQCLSTPTTPSLLTFPKSMTNSRTQLLLPPFPTTKYLLPRLHPFSMSKTSIRRKSDFDEFCSEI